MNKRQINGEKYNVKELVNNAISKVESDPARWLKLDVAERTLKSYGHKSPSVEQINAYAREAAILGELAYVTGANFGAQIGKWNFTNTDSIIASADEYLNRRNMGQKQGFAKKYLHK